MSDTWRQNAIVEAIQIIADKKIAQANFDKTIKATIYSIDDKATGTYSVKYQDSIFTANSTSTKINYQVGQQVLVLVPGNDMTRAKTIIGGVSNTAITYQEIPLADDISNKIGPSGSSLSQNIGLSSYAGDIVLNLENAKINDISEYIKRGDSITLGMVARTSLASSQIGGIFGITFNLIFKNSVTGEEEVKPLSVTNQDVIGNPYSLLRDTPIKVLIRDIDTENFVKIDSIQAFCRNFPQDESKKDIIDIIISDISINGAAALTESELNGYILHIDCSKNGDTLSEEVPKISLMAELKVNGNTTTQKTQYYWFRENGTVFKGNDRYNPYGGYGWECLNVKSEKTWVPKFSGEFEFNITGDDLENNSAHALQKVTKVLCVGVYDERQIVKGQIQIINNAIDTSIYIDSDEKVQQGDNIVNRTVYYLDNGKPNLKCVYDKEDKGEIKYQWSVRNARGGAVQSPQDPEQNGEYHRIENDYNECKEKAELMDEESRSRYTDFTQAQQAYNQVKNDPRIEGDTYHNFPISSITDYSVVSCAVTQDGIYRGTASITLYNKTSLEGMYSLNLENGTQVFQYDGKGNSPTSPQLEKKLEIRPLTFTLIDNQGKEIPHDQIRNNGWIKWIIPNTQTLLSSTNKAQSITGDLDLTVSRTDLPLPAGSYDVYSNLDSFSYAIADQYDAKKDINYIWLNIKFKDIILDAYTNFTFPKDGDPGTNGTDLVAKISGPNTTDRFYIRDKDQNHVFDDTGATIDNLKFQLYNNSIKIGDSIADYWCCPPITKTGTKTDKAKGNTYLSGADGWTKPKLGVVSKTVENILTDKPINIIRAQKNTSGNSGDLKYYAEIPICTEFVNGANYRLRVRPKTGFSYAVYLEDGSRPDYDNTMPFEVIVEKAQDISGQIFWVQDQSPRNYTWYAIGNIEEDSNKNQGLSGNKKFFKPKDKFAGDDLTSAVVVNVEGIGCIHIPVYMILNRYGHSALNGWDGNSIQLNANGDTILAPQVGAGSKDQNNTFTGVLMGNVKTKTSDDIGLFGYDRGNRSIFMDAKTGKTVLGKAGAGQITIDPSQNTARIYSGNYNYSPGTTAGKGMEIDLTDPHIRFGSGHFSVDNAGNITAKGGGTIAGWKIGNDALTSQNNNVYFRSQNYGNENNNKYAIYSNGTFSVTPDGLLHSSEGDIAGWTIKPTTLSKGGVTLNSDNSSTSNYAIRANNSSGTRKFSVDYNGNLYARAGDIAGWVIQEGQLSKKNTAGDTMSLSPTDGISFVNGADSDKKFTVNNKGYMTSTSGKIGGWNIEENTIWAGTKNGAGIRLNSDGSMNGGSGYNSGTGGSWAIYSNGKSTFTGITTDHMTATNATVTGNLTATTLTANQSGTIAGWKIDSSSLSNGDLVLSSTGGLSNGSNWSITKSGDAYFKNIYGTVKSGESLSGGGGASTGGGWTAPGSSGGLFSAGGPNGVSKPTAGKIIKKLTLDVYSLGEFYVPTAYADNVTFVTGLITEKDPTTGAITKITLQTRSGVLITSLSGKMDKITRTWGPSTELTPTLDIMTSADFNQTFDD